MIEPKKVTPIPPEFICPIGKKIMVDPVIFVKKEDFDKGIYSGTTYERDKAEAWQKIGPNPHTHVLVPNEKLKKEIEQFQSKQYQCTDIVEFDWGNPPQEFVEKLINDPEYYRLVTENSPSIKAKVTNILFFDKKPRKSEQQSTVYENSDRPGLSPSPPSTK